MRCVVIDKGLGLEIVKLKCLQAGAKKLKEAKIAGQIFCDLDSAGIHKLKGEANLVVREVQKILPPEYNNEISACEPVYAASQASYLSAFYELRQLFTPPLIGSHLVVAVLDSGIRKSHISLRDKVVYEENFTDSETCDDVFDHGTGVAYLAAGGRQIPGEEMGMAPGARLWNLKVLGDDGVGTEETVIAGMERVREMFDYAAYNYEYGDDLYPNAVNISWGKPDTGDPDDPIRIAVERLYGASPGKFPIFCAAGNNGPEEGSILLPAASHLAWAVGALTFSPFQVWEQSSRGPVVLAGESIVKPEMVFYGVSILTASSKSDIAFRVASGTSFACPLALGHLCLTREIADRLGFLDDLIELEYDGLANLTAVLCIKPEGSPLEKDNDYGLGMPFGDLVRRTFVPQETPITAITEMMVPVVGLMMLGTMASAMVKK